MKILFSPTKKMKEDNDSFAVKSSPVFLEKTTFLLRHLQQLSDEELRNIWGCNPRIAALNAQRIRAMDLRHHLSPALFSFDGIAFQYLAPEVFSEKELSYIEAHLCILSAFYGVLRPFDGIRAYRLEMNNRFSIDLYDYWGDSWYKAVRDDSGILINLASVEYSSAIRKYLKAGDRLITCFFMDEENGKLLSKGVYAKMSRGALLRYLAVRGSTDPTDMKEFNDFGFSYRKELSDSENYYFVRKKEKKAPIF